MVFWVKFLVSYENKFDSINIDCKNEAITFLQIVRVCNNKRQPNIGNIFYWSTRTISLLPVKKN